MMYSYRHMLGKREKQDRWNLQTSQTAQMNHASSLHAEEHVMGNRRAEAGPGLKVKGRDTVRVRLAMAPVPSNSTSAFTFSASREELK